MKFFFRSQDWTRVRAVRFQPVPLLGGGGGGETGAPENLRLEVRAEGRGGGHVSGRSNVGRRWGAEVFTPQTGLNRRFPPQEGGG